MQYPTTIQPPLPPGWIIATDPVSGRAYYANPTTGQTSWDPPAVVIPPPPPPPAAAHSTAAVTTTHQPYIPPNQESNAPSLVPMNPTLNASGLLIPAARAIMNKVNDSTISNNSKEHKTCVELHMTGGMIADLAKVQSNYRYDEMEENDPDHGMSREEVNKKFRYEPLKPFELPTASTIPHVEAGRVDIRLMTLMDALSKLENRDKK